MHPSPLNGVEDSLRRKAMDGWKMLSQKVKASKAWTIFCLGKGIWPLPKKKKKKISKKKKKPKQKPKTRDCSFQAPVGTAALNCARLEQTEKEYFNVYC